MANATVISLGQDNGAGALDALFLKLFGGEVLAAFEETCVTMDKHLVKTIPHGKSASFPATWKLAASYHTPGAEINGQAVTQSERVITIDDLLIAPWFIANIDEAKNHYDARSIYSVEAGRALANAWDKNVLQVGVLAARAAATVTGADGGSAITNASYKTDGAVLASGIFSAAQKLDEKSISENDRYAFVKPAQYYLMVQTTALINRDFGGSGVYAEGSILKVAGVSIVKANHLPTTNITSGPTAYQGDFSKTAALVMNKAAVGTVKLLDLAHEAAYDIRRQGTLGVSKYAIGHGILRPECSVEVATP